jgi:hypothetical protein
MGDTDPPCALIAQGPAPFRNGPARGSRSREFVSSSGGREGAVARPTLCIQASHTSQSQDRHVRAGRWLLLCPLRNRRKHRLPPAASRLCGGPGRLARGCRAHPAGASAAHFGPADAAPAPADLLRPLPGTERPWLSPDRTRFGGPGSGASNDDINVERSREPVSAVRRVRTKSPMKSILEHHL